MNYPGQTAQRVRDIVIVLATLPLTIPLAVAVACLVRCKLGSPVFFRQKRPGLGGRPFELIKFRSLTSETDSEGKLLPDEQRMTRFGRWLRASSLDELPELWNILRGDMSLVGPRPLMMQYLERYSAHQARRHDVLPGLTGWAQINGRNAVDWPSRFDLDVWYVDNRSQWLDLRIILSTFRAIVMRTGIQGEDSVTMKEFTGNPDQHPTSDNRSGR